MKYDFDNKMTCYLDGNIVRFSELNKYHKNHEIEFYAVNLETLELYFVTK